MKESGNYYFYQNDHLGTPHKMTELNGAVVWGAAYSAFGEAEVDVSSTVTNNLRFPGQYYDNETGLHYNYHRFYDPVVGRYLRKDPMGFRGGLNLFAYVDDNPINYFDPKGLGRYCGSGWFSFLVSDTPKGYDFSSCCEDHDKCYENDPETGYCNMTKPECDKRFFRCMTKVVDEMDINYLLP
jgi:RHS repeat-associated protein